MRKSALLVLSLVGLFDAVYLLWTYTSPSSPMVCIGGGCDAVRASSYSHFGGLPVPLFGVAMYAFLVLLAFIHALLPVSAARISEYVVAFISGAGFVVAGYLTGVEAFVLHAWCVWCLLSAALVTGIFILALFDLLRPAPPLDAVKALTTVQRNFGLILLAFVVAVPAFVVLTRRGRFPVAKPPSAQTVKTHLVRPDTHFYGDRHAPVTVVEFGDFQCSACRLAEVSAHKVRETFGDKIGFAFRQFPIASLHAHAEKAAEASECAAQQGKFWQAVDMFYRHQGDLGLPALSRYASELGLDSRKFVECLQSGQMASRVAQDIGDGRALGVRATPTFFVDGRMIIGPIEYPQFVMLIDNDLKKHEAEQASAVSAANLAATSKSRAAPTAPHRKASTRQLSPRETTAATMPVLGGGPRDVLSALQSSASACSEDEAKERQPTLIRTAQAEELFRDHAQTLFVDVRPGRAFSSGHIPGAVNLPIDDFEQGWSRLPKDKTIVLYEGGLAGKDICAASRAAGRILLAQGFQFNQVKVYQDGLAGWRKANLRVRR